MRSGVSSRHHEPASKRSGVSGCIQRLLLTETVGRPPAASGACLHLCSDSRERIRLTPPLSNPGHHWLASNKLGLHRAQLASQASSGTSLSCSEMAGILMPHIPTIYIICDSPVTYFGVSSLSRVPAWRPVRCSQHGQQLQSLALLLSCICSTQLATDGGPLVSLDYLLGICAKIFLNKLLQG